MVPHSKNELGSGPRREVDRERSPGSSMAEMEPLRRGSESLAEEFQEKLEHTLRVFKQKAAKQVAEEFPKLAERLLKHSAEQLQDHIDQATRRFQEQIEASGTWAAEEAAKRLAELERATLDSLTASAQSVMHEALGQATQTLGEHIRSAVETSRQEVSGAFAEQSQAASRLAAESVQAVQMAAEAAAARMQGTQEQLEKDLLGRHQTRLAELTAAGMKELEARSQALLAEFEERLNGTWHACRQNAAKRVADELPKIATELLERGSQQLQKQLDETVARLKSDFKASGETVVADTRKHLADAQKESTESFCKEARSAAEKALNRACEEAEERLQGVLRRADGAVTKIETAQQKMEAAAEEHATAFQKRLGQSATASLEAAMRELKAHAEGWEKKLDEVLQTYRQKAVEQAAREFPAVAGDVVERASVQLHRQAFDAAERIKGDLKNAGAQFVEEARAQVATQVQVSLQPVTEAAVEQCRGQLRTLAKDFAASSHKQLEEELQEVVRKQRRIAQEQVDEAARLHLERARQALAQIEPAARRKSAGRLALLVGATAPTLLFVFLASRPIMRLKADPPAEFFNAYPDWTASHHDVAQRLGRAYWDWAALHLAHEYPYGSTLPDQPPVEFDVEGPNFPTGVEADLARQKYWEKLRELWGQPQSWEKVPFWNRP